MSFYRSKYLRSDHWKTKRVEAIKSRGQKCELCKSKKSLDVHHLTYKRIFRESNSDLRVLCRSCHDKVHALLRRYPGLKKQHNARQWFIIWSRLHGGKPPNSKNYFTNKFSLCRDVLVSMKLVKRPRMPWRDELLKAKMKYNIPIIALEQYIKATGIDPRYHQARQGAHKLLN